MTISGRLRDINVLRSVLAYDSGDPAARAEMAEHVRAARLEAARRTSRWTELEAVDLVRRGRVFVAASDDSVYLRHRGVTFESGKAAPIADQAPLHFTVDQGGNLTFYEKQSATWTELVARKAKRMARR